MAKSGFDQIATELLRADTLHFSFTHRGFPDEERARSDLSEAIAVMVEAPAVENALAEATSALATRFTEETFARQVALVREKEALKARLGNLTLAEGEEADNAGIIEDSDT